MRCNAWNLPGGCYNYASAWGGGVQDGCPSATWFWLLAALAGVYVLAK